MKTNEGRLQNPFSYLGNLSHVKADEIPDIDSYINQITTFMDNHLKDMGRHPGDKALAKTTINNCAKSSPLPPPVRKKYSKDHMLILALIYYFKNLLSFSDTKELFRPITSKHFSGQASRLSLEDVYNEVFTLERGETNDLKSDVAAKLARVQDTFSDAPVNDEDREYLKLSTFICELSFGVYLKTQMIEMIAGQLREDAPASRKK